MTRGGEFKFSTAVLDVCISVHLFYSPQLLCFIHDLSKAAIFVHYVLVKHAAADPQ